MDLGGGREGRCHRLLQPLLHLPGHRGHQGTEQPLLALVEHQIFRMPLDPHQKAMSGRLDTLDHTGPFPRHHIKPIAEPVNRLMVKRVHPAFRNAQDAVETAVRLDANAFARQDGAHSWRLLIDLVDIHVERPAAMHIDHLGAAADAEHRYPAQRRAVQCPHLQPVPLGIDADVRPGRLTIKGGVDVVAPSHHQTVQVPDRK